MLSVLTPGSGFLVNQYQVPLAIVNHLTAFSCFQRMKSSSLIRFHAKDQPQLVAFQSSSFLDSVPFLARDLLLFTVLGVDRFMVALSVACNLKELSKLSVSASTPKDDCPPSRESSPSGVLPQFYPLLTRPLVG